MSSIHPSTGVYPRIHSRQGRPSFWQRQCRRWVLKALSQMPHGRLRLQTPDGAEVCFGRDNDGPTAWIQVINDRFFTRSVLQGDIGFGEAYVDGDWETDDLTAVIAWFCANVQASPGLSGSTQRPWHLNWLRQLNQIQHWRRANSVGNSKRNIQEHYDLGNRFYSLWLDPSLTYSSALFERPGQTLEEAQTAKYDRLCRQLRVKTGETVLEIGCGWGGFASHAVRNYGCHIHGITLSEEQLRFCQERAAREGWAAQARFELRDYRTLTETYDSIVSIEMMEAIGDEYLETFVTQVQRCLKPNGLFAAQFITCPDARHDAMRRNVDWIQKHIFPGSLLLSLNRVNSVMQQSGTLWLHDLRDMGTHYARTLALWREAFQNQRESVRALGFDEAFLRKWQYYLSYCEAAFATRNISVVQALWTHPNNARLDTPHPTVAAA